MITVIPATGRKTSKHKISTCQSKKKKQKSIPMPRIYVAHLGP